MLTLPLRFCFCMNTNGGRKRNWFITINTAWMLLKLQVKKSSAELRYYGRWIDSVRRSRSYMLAFWKKTSSTYTFSESLIVTEYNHIFEIFQNVIVAVKLKEIPRNAASLKLVRFRAWIIRAAQLTSEMFSHTSPSKRESAIQMCFFFSTPS